MENTSDSKIINEVRLQFLIWKTIGSATAKKANSRSSKVSLQSSSRASSFDQANIIGCGGFGLVFKATLPDGQNVAIKWLSGDTGEVDREFQAEVETLSRAQHPNLVLLQGYCQLKHDKFLIYSFMENGSLDYWLHEKPDGRSKLNWDTRLKIAQGAIKGLAVLLSGQRPPSSIPNSVRVQSWVGYLLSIGLFHLYHYAF